MEASRPKSQWDYLLEEMQWMAADFAQERRWKEAAAKKVRVKVVEVIGRMKRMSDCLAAACSHMRSLPSRTEEERREIKEREGNPASAHSQHNCTGGGILLVKHRAGT